MFDNLANRIRTYMPEAAIYDVASCTPNNLGREIIGVPRKRGKSVSQESP